MRVKTAFIGYGALLALMGWWTWRALHDPLGWDAGLAYNGGQVAWATGHPEHLGTWTGTPFLAATMAVLSRAFSVHTVDDLVTIVNLALAAAVIAVVLHRLRPLLSEAWWWAAAFGLVTFAPLMSSVWEKQFNVIALTLALGGFELVRRGRHSYGAAAIGFSVALKPLVILLPFVMLASRETRRAGVKALGWILGLNVAAQALFAARAGDLGPLDPLIALRNFASKSHPSLLACVNWNFAPGAMLCRLAGIQHPTLQRVVALLAVLLLGVWVIDALRCHPVTSWEVFAFVCALSAMLSPLAWTHYQIMLAPLFVLLLVRFTRERATVGEWAGLAVAFALASLMWKPYGTALGALHDLITDARSVPSEPNFTEGYAQFAQYILVVTGIMWYVSSRRATSAP